MAMARVLIALTAAGALLTGCGSSYDEAAHRSAVEAELGHSVADWPRYLEAARGTCGTDDDVLHYVVAMARDDGTYPVFEANLRHLCRERLDEIAEQDRERDEMRARCANPVTEEDRLLRDAYDELGLAC